MSWYAVMTEARAEWLAARHVEATGCGIFLPHFRAVVRHGRRLLGVSRPLFPRYLFADVPSAALLSAINRARGVATVVHLGDRALPIPDRVVAAMQAEADESGLVVLPAEQAEPAVATPVFRSGDTVRIISGPFAEMLAVIRGVDGRGKANLNLNILGGETPVTVPAASLVHADADRTARIGRGRVGRRQ